MAIVNSQLKKYVDEKDINGIRSTLTGLAYVGDKDSFQEFKISTEYAIENIREIFEEDDRQDLKIEYSLSGYKNVARMMMNNFSKKKYDAVIDIGLKIFEAQKKAENFVGMEEKEDNPLSEALKNPVKIAIVILIVIAIIILITKSI